MLQRLFHEPVEFFAALLLRLFGHRHLLAQRPDFAGEHVGLGLIEEGGELAQLAAELPHYASIQGSQGFATVGSLIILVTPSKPSYTAT